MLHVVNQKTQPDPTPIVCPACQKVSYACGTPDCSRYCLNMFVAGIRSCLSPFCTGSGLFYIKLNLIYITDNTISKYGVMRFQNAFEHILILTAASEGSTRVTSDLTREMK